MNTFEPEDESLYEIVPMSMNKYQSLGSNKDNDCSNVKKFNNKDNFQSKREPYDNFESKGESYPRKQFKDNFKKYTNEKDFLRKLDEEADESFKNSKRESDFTSKNFVQTQKIASIKKEGDIKDQFFKKSFELQKHQQEFIETESNEIRS